MMAVNVAIPKMRKRIDGGDPGKKMTKNHVRDAGAKDESDSEDLDDEDRPRSRRRSRSDDDDRNADRRSRDNGRDSKRKKKQPRKSRTVWIVAGAGLLIGVALLVWFLFLSGNSFDSEIIALLPAEVTDVYGIEVEDLLSAAIDKDKELLRFEHPEIAEFGLELDQVRRIIVAGGKNLGMIMVIRLTRDAGKEKLSKDSTEMKENGKTYYKSNKDSSCISLVSGKLIVAAEREDTIKSILKQPEGKVQISEDLLSLVKKAAKGHNWVASISEGAGHMGFMLAPEELKKLKGNYGYTKLSGRSVDYRSFIVCDSEGNSLEDHRRLSASHRRIQEES